MTRILGVALACIFGLLTGPITMRAEEIDAAILAEVASRRELHAFVQFLEAVDRRIAEGPRPDAEPPVVKPSEPGPTEPLSVPLPWAAPSPATLTDEAAHRVFAQAWLEIERKQYAAALARLKALRDEHPLHPKANSEYLWAVAKSGDLDAVASALVSLPENALSDKERLRFTILINGKEGQVERAIGRAHELLAIEPDDRVTLRFLILACHAANRKSDANAACERYLALHAGESLEIDRSIYTTRFEIRGERGDVAGGLNDATQALRLGSDPVHAMSKAWRCLMVLERFAMAQQIVRRLKQIAPDSSEYRHIEVTDFFIQGEDKQVLLLLKPELAKAAPDYGTLLVLFAGAMRSGDAETASQTERAILKH